MRYTEEFKAKIISEIEDVKSIASVCRRHNLPKSTARGWLKTRNNKVEYRLETSKKELDMQNKTLKKKLCETELELMILKDLLKKTYRT